MNFKVVCFGKKLKSHKKGGDMKPKVFSKKLVLNKKTVANLGKAEMIEVHGGHDSRASCPVVTACNCTKITTPC
jgi:hypothetical protein